MSIVTIAIISSAVIFVNSHNRIVEIPSKVVTSSSSISKSSIVSSSLSLVVASLSKVQIASQVIDAPKVETSKPISQVVQGSNMRGFLLNIALTVLSSNNIIEKRQKPKKAFNQTIIYRI